MRKSKVLALVFAALVLAGCGNYDTENTARRIKEKEITIILGRPYVIIEIDGEEYISSRDGGICPLVKKTK